jgi:hypothetical protein
MKQTTIRSTAKKPEIVLGISLNNFLSLGSRSINLMLKNKEHNKNTVTRIIIELVICSKAGNRFENSNLDFISLGKENISVLTISKGSNKSVRFASTKNKNEYIKFLLLFFILQRIFRIFNHSISKVFKLGFIFKH